ncbi:MAG: hypothetical protein QOF21_1963 [Actinomycetota bacterium]|jgi:hypothetical protein
MKKLGVGLVVALAFAILGPIAPASAAKVLVPPGGGPHVRIFGGTGNDLGGFFAYDPAFNGGVNVAVADVTGNADPEIVTGAGPGGSPNVRVFSLAGELLGSFLAYDGAFKGGVSVGAGNVDGIGKDEIVTGPGYGGGPHVRVFDGSGSLRQEWMAYDPAFGGGIHVAAGNTGGIGGIGVGAADVVTAPIFTGGPHVRVFGGNGALKSEWMAYSQSFTGGVSVAAGLGRVVTGAASNGGPHLRVFDGNGAPQNEWMAFDPAFTGGITVATGMVDGAPGVVAGAGPGGGANVHVFSPTGQLRGDFDAYSSYPGGVNVAAGDNRVVTGAGVARLVDEFFPGGVAGLQQRLLAMGFWLPSVNGKFDSNTTQAVWAFQKANNLPRDGKIGPEDEAALHAGARPSPSSTSGNLVEVDKARQLLFVIRNGTVEWAFNTSTGSNGTYTSDGHTYRAVTPEGHFTFDRQINGTRVSHLGTLFRPKYFTSAGHAIHGSSSIPPYPASHGCVRLSNDVINFIWDAGLAPLGSPIWVHS